MNDLDRRITRFIGHLESLARTSDKGALADLRSGLGKDPGEAPRMHKHVVPFLSDHVEHTDKWFYVVGALFGAHPCHEQGPSLGESFARLYRKRSNSPSIEMRFVAVLGSHPDDLPKRLGRQIGLFKAEEIGTDYKRLLWDLITWDAENRKVQEQWARDFYHSIASENLQGGTQNE